MSSLFCASIRFRRDGNPNVEAAAAAFINVGLRGKRARRQAGDPRSRATTFLATHVLLLFHGRHASDLYVVSKTWRRKFVPGTGKYSMGETSFYLRGLVIAELASCQSVFWSFLG